jgi:hypothetical protein
MKKIAVELKEPLQIDLKVVFIDKNFKYSWAVEFRPPDIERHRKMKPRLFQAIWEQYLENGITGVLKNFPDGWKSYDQYAKKFEKVINDKTKENERRMKKGKDMMSKREWQKGIPVFKSKLKPEDVRAIVIGKNCWIRVFSAKDLNYKTFQKIIKSYKI